MSDRERDGLAVKALASVRREKLLQSGDTVLVALSGGADSTALLNFLLEQREELALTGVAAAHVNHGLRGEESARDEAFVREMCSRLGVPLFVLSADVRGEAEENGEGVEEAGRRVRYAFLAQQAEKLHAVVATAHTLSDSMETVLFHMARGCGLHGLCGIPPKREIAEGDRHALVVRPLIGCTRADVEAYCADRGLPFVQDSTNTDLLYARNRIRARVIPELKAINPHADAALLRLMEHAREDEEFLDGLAGKALHEAALPDGQNDCSGCGAYNAVKLKALPPSVRVRALEAAVREACDKRSLPFLSLSDRQLEVAEELLETGGELTLGKAMRLRIVQGRLSVILRNEDVRQNMVKPDDEIPIYPGISCAFYGRIYILRLLALDEFEKNKKIHKNVLINSFNYDNITGNLSLRSRRPGDAFRPAGRGITKTLKKIFNEAKVSAGRRDAVPILCDDRGIVLVGGFSCDERVRVGQAARRVAVLESPEDDFQIGKG